MPLDFLSVTTAFLLFFFVSFQATATDPTYVAMICPNETTFTRNSTYFTNLRTLLSSLSSSDASYSAGFQNATAGQSPDMVTGLFLCRGDLSLEVCRGCVAFAASDTLNRCPRSKEVTIWYDECMLRYSDQNILSIYATKYWVPMPETQEVNFTQEDRLNEVMFATMTEAAQDATDSSRKFAMKKVNVTPFQVLYGLAQATPDLTREETYRCLLQATNQLSPGRIGGRILFPSCNSRYELYPFYNQSALQVTNPPPAAAPPSAKSQNPSVIIIAIVVPVAVSLLLFIAGYLFFAKRAREICGGYCFPLGSARKSYDSASTEDDAGDDDITIVQSLQFDFRIIEAVTNNFSESNRVGQGGFGEVYKGTFPNGEEVAVKRLLKTSGQGAKEFKNEVMLAVKLKHKNLVRLLGFCLEGEEKILIYEFVPNKSLDYFLFDPTKKGQLDWTRRYKIIEGVARGILYIHQDSQLTVIHRDLKASNILLDEDMNPKISDFGMAKIFGVDQTQANTNQIVGTFGYMSPEYVMHGHVSKKSDVYSFGVLILEIISGEQNSNFSRPNSDEDLVTYAWKLWRKGSPLAILDPAMADNYESNEVIRCIHIGLSCVQENPAKRPTLSTIVLMLTSNTITLPVPQQPGFFFRTGQESGPIDRGLQLDKSADLSMPCSIDDASITYPYPR